MARNPVSNLGHGPASSASAPLSAEDTAPDGPGKRLRRNAAPQDSIPRRGEGCRALALEGRRGGRQDERWPGASKREAGPEIPSFTWAPQLGIEIHEKKLHVSKCCFEFLAFDAGGVRIILGGTCDMSHVWPCLHE